MKNPHQTKAGPGRRHAVLKGDDVRFDKREYPMTKTARSYLTKYASIPMFGTPHHR